MKKEQHNTKGQILIIEDDRDIRETLVQVLEFSGYTALSASNGVEGLKALSKGRLPCLVLLDLMMPIMNGYDFLKEISKYETLKDLPILVISAFNLNVKPLNKVIGILKKPFRLEQLTPYFDRFC